MLAAVALLLLAAAGGINAQCTVTTASGTYAPTGFCAGDLIFEDNFDTLDMQKWEHEITMSGGGNWEFQVYSNNRSNSYVEGGNLHIHPTFTIDQYGPDFLSVGTINLDGGAPADACTNPSFYGCERAGTATNFLNPIKSARVRSVRSFTFKYGKIEIRAQMPLGDWIWPALWMMPAYNQYGTWPASGEIDISEVRSNRDLTVDGVNIGIEQTGSTLHFGPFWPLNGFEIAHWDKNFPGGLHLDYHIWTMDWTPDYMSFLVDGIEMGRVTPTDGGFWEYGGFGSQRPEAENPWRGASKMAPFDQEFYIILNLAVGGTNGYFPDNAVNNPPKPWSNQSPTAFRDFWEARGQWEPTWNQGSESNHMKVDYVRVWAG